jgi:hypothetical protein
MLQNLHPIHSRESQIEDDNFWSEAVKRSQSGLSAQLSGYLVAQTFEVVPNTAQNIHIVIDQQDRSSHEEFLDPIREVPTKN